MNKQGVALTGRNITGWQAVAYCPWWVTLHKIICRWQCCMMQLCSLKMWRLSQYW